MQRNKNIRAVLILLLIWLMQQHACAQQNAILKKRFPVKDISYENGLLDNNVSSIITDAGGFTWLSTFTGSQRFNGYNLETINPVAGKDTFIINYPVHFFGLNNDCIWISIKEGLLQYDPHTDKFNLITLFKKSNASYFGIVPLKETNEGIWCMQEDKGIVLYDKNGALKDQFNFFSVDIINGILESGIILYDAIIAVDDNEIYITNNHTNILAVNTQKHLACVINVSSNKISGVACLHHDLYAVTTSGFIIIDNAGKIKKVLPNAFTDEKVINSSLLTINNNELLLSMNGHLYDVDSSGKIQFELTDKGRNIFIANGYIEKVYADKFNRIWILSNDAVKRVQNSELLFDHLTYPNEQHNFTRALYYDKQKNTLLAGGYNGSLALYDSLATPLWQKQVVTKVGEFITNIEKLSADNYLITAYHNGWVVFNCKTKEIQPLSFSTSSLEKLASSFEMNYPCNLHRVNDSVILIATNNNVYKCIFKATELLSAKPLLDAKMNAQLNCFLIDHAQNLWVGTITGLLYILRDNKLTTLHIAGNYSVRSMAEDDHGNILVGTEKGLFIYKQNGSLQKRIDVSSGLRNDCIYGILTSENNYYVSTNLGISSIATDGTIHNYPKEMGLQDNEFNTNATLKTGTGKMFFGGVNGVTAFYPSKLMQVKDSPQIHVTQLMIDDSSYNSSAGIWHGDMVKLKYNQNRLRFDIAAMGIFNASEYVYQYRLKELDTVWQTTNQPTNINYTLQPGTYTLEIKCHPLLSSTETFLKNFQIIIIPPFWQTWWFNTVAVAFVIAAIYLIVYRYNRKKYMEKIRALETQQQIQNERERISRELHDNIGSQLSFIISNIDWTIESNGNIQKEEEKKNLIAINETARNVMGNLRESIWALNKEKIMLEEFADKLKAYVQNIISIKQGIQFISTEEINFNISFSPVDALNIFRICQECINNTIKHSEATVLKMNIASASQKNFSITIEDNGKGFEVNQNVNNHYGLENIQHRALELEASLSIESETGKGTKIFIHK